MLEEDEDDSQVVEWQFQLSFMFIEIVKYLRLGEVF